MGLKTMIHTLPLRQRHVSLNLCPKITDNTIISFIEISDQ